jgi:hypothetical protein
MSSAHLIHDQVVSDLNVLVFFFSHQNQMIEAKFTTLLDHSRILLRKRWLYGIFDDFVTKQLPHNVTWGLSLLYALEHRGDQALTSIQGKVIIKSATISK